MGKVEIEMRKSGDGEKWKREGEKGMFKTKKEFINQILRRT